VVLSANWSNYDRPDGLERTIGRLVEAGKRVYVVLTPPQYDYSVPRALALARLRGRRRHRAFEPWPSTSSSPAAVAALPGAGGDNGTRSRSSIRPRSFAAPEPAPSPNRTRAFYYDIGHLSVTGARHISSLFDPVFAPPSARLKGDPGIRGCNGGPLRMTV
jgi:hypothetical protein